VTDNPVREKTGGVELAARALHPEGMRRAAAFLRSELPLPWRIAAARVEHARLGGGGTQVSSPRSERALTVVVKTRRSLNPVEVRATGCC